MVITNVNQVVYQGDGVTTAFPFTFRIIDDTDIKLLLLDSDGTETDILSDYFVDTENNTVHYPGYAHGAEPALSDRPPVLAEGQKLVIYRKLPITQEKDLGDKWPFYVIELGLDKLTMILQDIWDWLGRCLCVSKGQAYEAGDDFDPTIPLEADKVICGNESGTGFDAREAMMEVNGHWDGEGRQIHSVADPTADQDAVTKKYADSRMDNNFMKLQPDGTAWEGRNLPISNVAGPALVLDAANKDYVDRILAGYSGQGDRFVFFDNVEQMQLAKPVPSQMAITLGYHDVNDGGAGVYTIRDKGADTPDGGSIIEIPGTDYVAELITDGIVNVKQFGAKGNGTTDDAVPIQNAIDTNFNVYFPSANYVIKSSLTVDKAKTIIGENATDTILIFNNNTDGFIVSHNNVNFENLNINGISYTPGGNKSGISYGSVTPYFKVKNVRFFYFNRGLYSATFVGNIVDCIANNNEYGFYLIGGPNILVEHCYALDCLTGYYMTTGYSAVINCACDRANVAYQLNGNKSISLVGCGCEYCGTYLFADNLANFGVLNGSASNYQRNKTPIEGANDFVLKNGSVGTVNGYRSNISGTSLNEATVYSIYVKDSVLNMNNCVFQLPAYIDANSQVYGFLQDDTNLITNATFVSKDTWTLTGSSWNVYFDLTDIQVGEQYEISCYTKQGDQEVEINASKWLSGEIDGTNINFHGKDVQDNSKSVQSYTFTVTQEMVDATLVRFYLRGTPGQPFYRRNWQCVKLPHKFTFNDGSGE